MSASKATCPTCPTCYGDTCRVDGCNVTVYCEGLCCHHQRGGDALPQKPREATQTAYEEAFREFLRKRKLSASSSLNPLQMFIGGWEARGDTAPAAEKEQILELKLEIERLKHQAAIDAQTLGYRQALLNKLREEAKATRPVRSEGDGK